MLAPRPHSPHRSSSVPGRIPGTPQAVRSIPFHLRRDEEGSEGGEESTGGSALLARQCDFRRHAGGVDGTMQEDESDGWMRFCRKSIGRSCSTSGSDRACTEHPLAAQRGTPFNFPFASAPPPVPPWSLERAVRVHCSCAGKRIESTASLQGDTARIASYSTAYQMSDYGWKLGSKVHLSARIHTILHGI